MTEISEVLANAAWVFCADVVLYARKGCDVENDALAFVLFVGCRRVGGQWNPVDDFLIG